MAREFVVRVAGWRETMRAFDAASKEAKKALRAELRKVGQVVREEASRRFSTVDAGSAAGFRVRVRRSGISVEQSKRRVTGKRPDYGALQMRRALLPAAEAKKDEFERELEAALDRIADNF